MKKFIVCIVLAIGVSALAACSSGNSIISPVTPLPTTIQQAGEIATIVPPTSTLISVATTFDTSETSDENTLTLLEATATQGAADSVSRSSSSNNFAFITNTPAPNRLDPGEARAIAIATDTFMQPEIETPIIFTENPVRIQFSEFYAGYSIRTGLQFSDKLQSLDGQQVIIEGYVAPPLKPRLDFFVLTRIQLAFCPFCSSDTEWPDDIALVYLPEPDTISTEYPVRITGQIEVGTSVDAETGMVSLVRVYAEDIEQLR